MDIPHLNELDFHQLFSLDKGLSLVAVNDMPLDKAPTSNNTAPLGEPIILNRSNDSTQLKQECWFVARDNTGNAIGRFRSWRVESSLPPYRQMLGWERYSLQGAIIDREIRYGKAAAPKGRLLH